MRVAGREDQKTTRAGSPSRSRSRNATHGRKAQHHSDDEPAGPSASPPWLDFVLVGGFVYLDKAGRFLQANSLSYQANSELASSEVFAEGPHDAASEVGQAMVRAGRMDPVTLPALKEIGFQCFGWVNPREEFAGHAPLSCDYGQSAAQSHGAGAFLYGSASGAFFFYALSTATSQDPEVAERRQAIRVSAAGMALDNALRGSVVKLRESVNRAQDMVAELLKEEERSTHARTATERCASPWIRAPLRDRLPTVEISHLTRSAPPQPLNP